jgi:hypothetical protein
MEIRPFGFKNKVYSLIWIYGYGRFQVVIIIFDLSIALMKWQWLS